MLFLSCAKRECSLCLSSQANIPLRWKRPQILKLALAATHTNLVRWVRTLPTLAIQQSHEENHLDIDPVVGHPLAVVTVLSAQYRCARAILSYSPFVAANCEDIGVS